MLRASPAKNLFFRFPAIVEVNDVSRHEHALNLIHVASSRVTTHPAANSSRTLTSQP